jgi:hypothetical protein
MNQTISAMGVEGCIDALPNESGTEGNNALGELAFL